MPVFNTQHFAPGPIGHPDPSGFVYTGAVIPVEIHIPAALAAFFNSNKQPLPPPAIGLALIDTGATVTSIHEPILQSLRLPIIGSIPLGSASGTNPHNLYPAMIRIPAQNLEFDRPVVIGVNLTGQLAPITQTPNNIVCLIGRDVLAGCVFVYNGPGAHWSLSL